MIIRGEWSVGSLLAFQSYVGFVYGPAQFLATANFQWQGAMASLERVSALFDVVPEEHDGVGLKAEHLRGEVEFKDVCFSYNGRETVLDDVSFAVRAGEHMAIVGPSGVGKTTLVSLLLQFYRPQKGEIFIDGRPAIEYELHSLRRRIGYVPQSPTLLIRHHRRQPALRRPRGRATTQVEEAARAAGIHDFIASLPQGLPVPGRRARRQLLRGAEAAPGHRPRPGQGPRHRGPGRADLGAGFADRGVDLRRPARAGARQDAVHHRPSPEHHPQKSDRILCFNDKGLVGAGSHDELQEKCDYYQELLGSQMRRTRKKSPIRADRS